MASLLSFRPFDASSLTVGRELRECFLLGVEKGDDSSIYPKWALRPTFLREWSSAVMLETDEFSLRSFVEFRYKTLLGTVQTLSLSTSK